MVVLERSGSVSEAEVQSEASYSPDKQMQASVTHTLTRTPAVLSTATHTVAAHHPLMEPPLILAR